MADKRKVRWVTVMYDDGNSDTFGPGTGSVKQQRTTPDGVTTPTQTPDDDRQVMVTLLLDKP